jgi:hypothetical protein
MPSPVDRLHDEFVNLVAFLEAEPSLQSTADDSFRKSILLAAASFFEFRLSRFVADFALEASNSSSLIAGIIAKKAIDRQYHTWFDWDRNNANQFYRLFGTDFVDFMRTMHASEPWLDGAVGSFMELGRARNLLVHENFAAFALEKTAAEIFVAYTNAIRFVEEIPNFLRQCNKQQYEKSSDLTSEARMVQSLQQLRLDRFCK